MEVHLTLQQLFALPVEGAVSFTRSICFFSFCISYVANVMYTSLSDRKGKVTQTASLRCNLITDIPPTREVLGESLQILVYSMPTRHFRSFIHTLLTMRDVVKSMPRRNSFQLTVSLRVAHAPSPRCSWGIECQFYCERHFDQRFKTHLCPWIRFIDRLSKSNGISR